jgi:hypothetical protein
MLYWDTMLYWVSNEYILSNIYYCVILGLLDTDGEAPKMSLLRLNKCMCSINKQAKKKHQYICVIHSWEVLPNESDRSCGGGNT